MSIPKSVGYEWMNFLKGAIADSLVIWFIQIPMRCDMFERIFGPVDCGFCIVVTGNTLWRKHADFAAILVQCLINITGEVEIASKTTCTVRRLTGEFTEGIEYVLVLPQ
jgi:hypothetical protein